MPIQWRRIPLSRARRQQAHLKAASLSAKGFLVNSAPPTAMQTAPVPQDETSRLEALRALQLLDTPTELEFDDITALASLICETPIALISLVDQDRQWFKSRFGLDAQQTARDISFCSHAILGTDIFEVEDASVDER